MQTVKDFFAAIGRGDREGLLAVFDPSIKVETDRFAYRFVKP